MMSKNKEIIKSKIEDLKQKGSAVIFDIVGQYVQLVRAKPGMLYCEAVSHNFNPAVSKALEESFSAMGFKLDEKANYSRNYTVNTAEEINKLVQDINKIFTELYRLQPDAQMEVIEVE
jgi:hypothetical protein